MEERKFCSICGKEMFEGFTDCGSGVIYASYACSEECLCKLLDQECGSGNWGISEEEGENGGYYYNIETGEDTGWFYTMWF